MTGIDRDGIIAILTGLASETADVEGAADRILSLLRPVESDRDESHYYGDGHAHGVTLTPEEARIAAAWYTGDPQDADSAAELALARKLEDPS